MGSLKLYELLRVCLHASQVLATILIPIIAVYLDRYLKNKAKKLKRAKKEAQ